MAIIVVNFTRPASAQSGGMMLDTPGDEQISGQIVARKLSSSRIEFGWLPSDSDDADRVLPSPRFFPANPTVDKWLSSGSVAVAGSAIGHVEARRLHDGRTEFAFTPADQIERIYPNVRYFPPDARVGRWLKSSAITFTPGPDDGGDTMEAPNEDELDATTQPPPEPPTTPPAPATGYSAVSAGDSHTCAIRASNGAIECWGANHAGQSNDPAGTFRAVSAGGGHTCAIRTNGAIECWGIDGDVRMSDIPAGTFRAVAAGQHHTCAIRTNGAIECWGYNHSGQASPPPGSFSAVAAGQHHTCAIRTSGAIECWGDNHSGQTAALTGATGRFRAISAGALHTCGLQAGASAAGASPYGALPDGAFWCWGANVSGQINQSFYEHPTVSYSAISAGGEHTCALRHTGEIECWGSNEFGQTDVPGTSEGDSSEPERLTVPEEEGERAIPEGELAGDGGDHPTPEPRVETSTSTTPLQRDASVTMDPTAAPLPPLPVGSEDTSYGYIVARLGTDSRIEFGWQAPSGAGYFPFVYRISRNYEHNRWLRSSPISVLGAEIGRINVRLSGDGGTEFAFTPTDGERIEPDKLYFPADAQVGIWLRTSWIILDDTAFIGETVEGGMSDE